MNKLLMAIVTAALTLITVISLSGVSCRDSEDISEPDVSTTQPSETTTTFTPPNYTDDELFCMAAAIYNEAGGNECSDTTRRLVGYVILNRVKDSRFPNTIREVLEAKGQYGTFYRTGVKFPSRSSSAGEAYAVARAYRIAAEVLKKRDNVPIPSNVVFQAEFEQGALIYTYQDGMYFCCAKEVK